MREFEILWRQDMVAAEGPTPEAALRDFLETEGVTGDHTVAMREWFVGNPDPTNWFDVKVTR